MTLLKKAFLFITLIVVSYSCKHNEYDATYAAKSYCNCLEKEKNLGRNFFDARTKCDGEMLSTNKFFRTFYIEDHYGKYMFFLSQNSRDSVVKFRNTFFDYVDSNCCKVATLGCDKGDSFQIKRMMIDTFYRK